MISFKELKGHLQGILCVFKLQFIYINRDKRVSTRPICQVLQVDYLPWDAVHYLPWDGVCTRVALYNIKGQLLRGLFGMGTPIQDSGLAEWEVKLALGAE